MYKKTILWVLIGVLMCAAVGCAGNADSRRADIQTPVADPVTPEEILTAYVAALNAQDYEKMYGFISGNSTMSKEDYLKRNKNIYEGIEAANIEISGISAEGDTVSFTMSMDTQAGPVSFENTAQFSDEDGVSKLDWTSNMIFPSLNDDEKVRVKTATGERGSILDRNGELLAGKSDVYEVGLVPGKIKAETRDADMAALAEMIGITVDTINSNLAEKWVKDDLFVPLNKKVSYTDTQLKERLIAIGGVRLNTVQERVYKLGEKAAGVTGYIHNINADELKEHAGQGYTSESKIGKLGVESLFEERIRGIDGCKIYIVDKDGNEKAVIAETAAHNGDNVTLTIDAALQAKLYDQMKNDKGTAVVMDPQTGEILALVNTPSYDPNAFILGLNDETWAQFNNEETRPMFNRFKATYVPGSSIKPIIAALGITKGAFTPDEDFGPSGKAWHKDNWGSYEVTTLEQYSGAANVKNALIYSDNIYFAKAAVKIGGKALAEGLKSIGFGEQMPFEFGLGASTFGTELAFSDDLDLATSGYGQSKVELNPVHMASIYSAFLNGGDMLAPHLEKGKDTEVWKESVFSDEAVQAVKEAMVQVIDNPEGTAHEFKIDGVTIAGKTGTAEIKSSREDTEGTELGWFVAFPAGEKAKPYLVVTMIEDVKDRHGSHYVLPIVRALFAD